MVATLLAADVPIAPVQSHAEMAATEHLRDRGTVLAGADGALSFGPLVRLPGARSGPPLPAPTLDQHAGLGFPENSLS